MQKRILTAADVDKNLQVTAPAPEPDVVYYDIKNEPFDIYGLYRPKEYAFCRMPSSVAKAVSPGVFAIHRNAAGGRVRFATDSRYVAIRCALSNIARFPHMPLTGTAGMDIYIDDAVTGATRYAHTFVPPYDVQDGYSSILDFRTRRMRYVTIHLPLYTTLDALYIGLQKDAKVEHGLPYRPLAPVVYYGSSITQGGCASRAGNAYPNVVTQRTGIDHINLGFSGNAKGEQAMADYIASLDMSAFVCDYDHNAPPNAPGVDHLRKTHEPLYRTVREKHPTLPYIMLSRPDVDNGPYPDVLERRNVIYETYRKAVAEGDKNVYFIDGERLMSGPYVNMALVDNCHPTDLGFALMADTVTDVLLRALSVANKG